MQLLAGFVVLLALTVPGVAVAQESTAQQVPDATPSFEAGMAALKAGDFARATVILRALADQGHAIAQFNLGLIYGNTQGVPQDDAQAAKWYRLAAEQGYAKAQFNLGNMYDKGRGVPRDDAQAVKWFRLAADQGYANAQFNLGVMYDHGEGVPRDYIEAYFWFDLATYQGISRAAGNLEEVMKKMTPAAITEAERRAEEWLEQHQVD